ncbi:MAG: response regulator [Deltaproteobacteria bacterium]|nr:MAG: response regulator [Deltaproteobacteria bacterium]
MVVAVPGDEGTRIAEVLADAGYRVQRQSRAGAAGAGGADVVIVDDAAGAARGAPAWDPGGGGSPRVLAVVGPADPPVAVADAYLARPVAPAVLLAQVRALLRSRDAARSARGRQPLDALRDPVVVTRGDGVIVHANRAFAELAGRGQAELAGVPVATVCPPLAAAAPPDAASRYEVTVQCGDRWYHVTSDPAGECGDRVWLLRDLTRERESAEALREQQKRLEQTREQLMVAQKMEAIARLAGGMAHDFNNLLTVIMLTSHELLAHAADDRVREQAEAIQQAAERGADLTRRLLAVGRREPDSATSTPLGSAFAGLRPLLVRTLPESIDLDFDVERDVVAIVPPAHLDQILLNLVVNARDAIGPAPGRIRLAARAVSVDAPVVGCPDRVEPGRYAVVEVADSGPGIAPAEVARIFEPFYTTKPPGAGSGLGLPTVHGLVAQHGGAVTVHNEPGGGAVFRVYLPEGSEARPAAAPDVAGARRSAGGIAGRHVLLVEDDPAVRRSFVRAIESAGGVVAKAASSAEEALAWVHGRAAAGGGIDALLSDVVTPGTVSAVALADDVRRRWPGCGVVFVSGYAADLAAVQDASLDGVEFLPKPVRGDDVVRALARVAGR